MSILADILTRQRTPEPSTDELPWQRIQREVRDWLKDTPVIVINEVAQYFFDVFWNEHDALEDHDFPNVAPPFPCFWMEYRVPKWIVAGDPPQRVEMEFGGQRFGFYWLARNLPAANSGWELHSLTFTEDRESGLAVGPMFSVRARTDARGELLELAGQRANTGDEWPKEEDEAFHTSMTVLHYPVVLAVCLMHCANVKLVDHEPKESHARKHQALYGRAPIVYKTLDIAPMRRVIQSEGGAKCSARQALHIMRGHFKRFEEKPLFGRYRGMWWWSSQVRGSLDKGYVKKTYHVRTPKMLR